MDQGFVTFESFRPFGSRVSVIIVFSLLLSYYLLLQLLQLRLTHKLILFGVYLNGSFGLWFEWTRPERIERCIEHLQNTVLFYCFS